MKGIGRFVSYIILGINVFFVVMLVLSAYSPYLHPQTFSFASCLGLVFPVFLAVNLCFLVFWIVFNFRYALFSLFGLLICFSQILTYFPINSRTEEIPEGSIKLLSYNVMGFNGLTKKEGKNPILSYVANSGADIICLQEYAYSGNERYLTKQDIFKALKEYPFHFVGKHGKGDAQLACFSKFPILSAKPVDYESDYNGSMQYLIKVNNDTLLLINNHLESNKLTLQDRGIYEDMIDAPDAKKVKWGARLLLNKLAEASAIRSYQADSVANVIERSRYSTMIVCGDFNDAPISYTHRVLTRKLDDAFTKSGRGLGISYNRNKFYFRIDNILISPDLKAYNCTVDRSISDSDHYPIWCYINKKSVRKPDV